MRTQSTACLVSAMASAVLLLLLPGTAPATEGGAGIPDPPTATGNPINAGTDYPDATAYPASPENYSPADRPNSTPVNKIVIHVAQGSWEGSISWFQNPAAKVSAHYVVRSSDGAIAQSVRESDIAWHAGHWDYNETSIGVEHEGYVDEATWFTEEMYASSARLVADIATRYNIPVDRAHIIGHDEVPGTDHTDPGPHWDWNHYLELVRQHRDS